MRTFHTLVAAALVAGSTTSVGALELSTAPIAARMANTLLTCTLQNAGASSGTARVQIVQVPDGAVVSDSGAQSVSPGAGLVAGAIAFVVGGAPPDCTNGDCPCPNSGGAETCGHFAGAAYCRFVVDKKKDYRAAGCVSAPATAPASSPSCSEPR